MLALQLSICFVPSFYLSGFNSFFLCDNDDDLLFSELNDLFLIIFFRWRWSTWLNVWSHFLPFFLLCVSFFLSWWFSHLLIPLPSGSHLLSPLVLLYHSFIHSLTKSHTLSLSLLALSLLFVLSYLLPISLSNLTLLFFSTFLSHNYLSLFLPVTKANISSFFYSSLSLPLSKCSTIVFSIFTHALLIVSLALWAPRYLWWSLSAPLLPQIFLFLCGATTCFAGFLTFQIFSDIKTSSSSCSSSVPLGWDRLQSSTIHCRGRWKNVRKASIEISPKTLWSELILHINIIYMVQ